jgi:hypothetical protein
MGVHVDEAGGEHEAARVTTDGDHELPILNSGQASTI